MKGYTTLLASLLSAQLVPIYAEVAEVPEVKLTKIDPNTAHGALKRLIDREAFQVVTKKKVRGSSSKQGRRQTRKGGRRLKSDKKGYDGGPSGSPPQSNSSPQGTGRTGSHSQHRSSGPPPNNAPTEVGTQTSRTSPQSGTASAGKKTTRAPARPDSENPPEQANTARHYNDDYEAGDDTSYYDDYFDNYDDKYYYDDHYYYDDKYYNDYDSPRMSGKGKGGSSGDYHDDDYFFSPGHGDGTIDGERGLFLEAFQDSRGLRPPITIGPNVTDVFLPGTVTLFNDVPVHHLDFIDAGALLGIVQGTCTRTDRNAPGDMGYTGEGVCQLTYEILEGSHVVASFTAEGAVDNDINGSVLTVTGGLGELEHVTGMVTLQAATINAMTQPPTIVPDGTLDFLSAGDGYYMRAELYVDFDVTFPVEDIPDQMPEMPDMMPPMPNMTAPTVPNNMNATIPPVTPPVNGTDGGAISAGNGGYLGIVMCPDMRQEDYCDCLADSDCLHFAESRCSCPQARRPTCCGAL